MNSLSRNPTVVSLTRSLGLNTQGGDCLQAIEAYAVRRTGEIIERSPIPVQSLEVLKHVLADALSTNLRFLRSNADLEIVAEDFGSSFPGLRRRLNLEFNERGTEGLLLENLYREEWDRRYLAIVDCRGAEANRANFTSWHELIHVLIAPESVPPEGLRRGRIVESRKDPLEQVVDAVAGRLAFYDPLFVPVFLSVTDGRPLTFDLVEQVRLGAAPDASFQSTAMACVRVSSAPMMLIKIEYGMKASQRRALRLSEACFSLGQTMASLALRVSQCYANDASKRTTLKIYKQMRVPPNSVLATTYHSIDEREYEAVEDQRWWETSRSGPLASLPLAVRAIRRGGHVYGLVVPRDV